MSARPIDDSTPSTGNHGPVLAAMIALLGHHQSADHQDALMNAVVAVLEREVEAGESVGAKFDDTSARRYALRAIHNRLIDEWRIRARHTELRGELVAPSNEDNDLPHNRDSTLHLIASALVEELSPADRELLDAYLTSREAYRGESARQGLTATTARARICRLLRRLRDDGRRLRSPVAGES